MASHVRSYEPGKATTLTEHMPKSHQKYLGRTPSRLIEEAQQIGACTGQLVEAILAAKRHPERAFGRAWGFCAWRKPIRPSAWKRPPGVPAGSRLQLPKHGLDTEEPARPAADAWRSARSACRGPRQHSRRRLLRFPAGGRSSGDSVDYKENHAQPTND